MTLIRWHNIRDYFQNQPPDRCPSIWRYDRGFAASLVDWLFTRPRPSDLVLPAELEMVPTQIESNKYYQVLESTSDLQQAIVAFVLFLCGGWDTVVWACAVRLAATYWLFGTINYFCHTYGYRSYTFGDVAEEGRNNLLLGVISMGEGWHNNHHARPRSAQIGEKWWEIDLGYWSLWVMERLGLAWEVKRWREVKTKMGVVCLDSKHASKDICGCDLDITPGPIPKKR